MSDHTQVILLNVVPLLALAALYLGVAAALAPVPWRGRRFSWSGLGVWMLFLFVGALAGTIGGAKVDDAKIFGGLDPWPVLALTIVASVPALVVLARRPEGSPAVTARRRSLVAEEHATERGREADAVSRLSHALSRSSSAREAAGHLFAELESVMGIDTALLAIVDEPGGRARGFAARGVDEEWWQGVSVDLERDPGGIASVARERAHYAVYDLSAAPSAHASLVSVVGAKSAAWVPLISEGRLTGVLVAVAKASQRFFSASELELMQRLADEAAPALGRARSAEALQAALDRERLVREISRKVRSELDLDTVLEVAVEETGRALGVTRCFIRLGEPGEPLPIRAEWDAPGIEPIGEAAERLPVSNLAARERRTVAVGDVATAPEIADPSLGGRETLIGLGTLAVLATPILVFDHMIGIFGLHRSETGAWSSDEVSLAEAVAGEIGVAIHTARLLGENRRRLEQQAALVKAGQVVSSELRLETVLQRLVDEVTTLLHADAADCYLLDSDRRRLRCAAVRGLPAVLVGLELPPGHGVTGRALETGRPVIANDYQLGEGAVAGDAYAGFRSAVVAPIIWLGEIRGVLGVGSRDPERRFEETDAELLEAFARFASLALHNAESFEERERQARVQRGFYRIAEVLASPVSLRETFDALAQTASEALGGACALVLQPAGGGLALAGSHELPPALAHRLAGGLAASAGPFLAAARKERIVSSSALAEDDRFDKPLRRALAEAGYGSLLCAPVAGGRGQSSAAVVVLFTGERSFSDDELALARHLTGAARGTLERSELFETERRARNFSQRLAGIGARIVTNLDPAVVLEEVVQEAPRLLDADAAAIRLLEGEELVVRAAAGPGSEGLVGIRASSGAGLAGDVAQSRSPSAVEDARAAPRLTRSDPLLESMPACLAAPMIAHGGGLHGLLTAYAAERRAWREDEVQALVALAAVASAALSNAELYQRVVEEKERSGAILANIADGIVAVDREERIVLWNAMAERITGVPTWEALGRRVAEVLQRELAGDWDPAVGERQVAILRGGKEVWLSLTEAVMLDPTGAVAGRIFAFRDVSTERVVEQMKSDFVSTVSHELRSPLTSIYGFAETLLRRDVAFDEEERATFLHYIASESERLIRIVDDLLDVARLESGTLGLTLAETDVAEVVSEVVARFEEHAGERRFVVDLPPGTLCAQADRAKLGQILLNLVDNAVKFSPEGSTITISGRRKADVVEVRVTDEGVGIPPADQERIFTKFYRAETAPVSGVQGTGLGLFLVKGLVAAMGGRIWVDSNEGTGSSFSFELPVSKSTTVGMKAMEAAGRS